MKKNSLIYLGLFTLLSCVPKDQVSTEEENHDSQPEQVQHFQLENLVEQSYNLSYFSGKAEVSTYKLDRARYDDEHLGEAVLIFVTEPFLPKQQVKSDKGANKNTLDVLKMNRIDRFSTGVYDYSMFTSVFTP